MNWDDFRLTVRVLGAAALAFLVAALATGSLSRRAAGFREEAETSARQIEREFARENAVPLPTYEEAMRKSIADLQQSFGELQDKLAIRPRGKYVGPTDLRYVPIDDR